MTHTQRDTTDAWSYLLTCYRSGQISARQWAAYLEDPEFSAWVTGQNLERATPVEDIQSTDDDIRSTMDEQAYWKHLANILAVNLWGWTYKNSGSFHWGENMRYTVSIPGEFAEKIFSAIDRVKNSNGKHATVAANGGGIRWQSVAAECYQAVGALAYAFGVSDDPNVIRLLDMLAYGQTVDGRELLPFPALASEFERVPTTDDAGDVLTADDVRERLRQACAAAGGRNKWARENDTTRSYVSLVLTGGFPGPLITNALGLKRNITWSPGLAEKPLDKSK